MFSYSVLNYCLMGLAFLIFIEVLHSKTKGELKMYERFIIAVIWPLTLLIFVGAFIYGVFQTLKNIKNRDD